MGVSQCPETLEKLLARSPHLLPSGIGIKNHRSIGDRTTAAQRRSQIVYSTRFKTFSRAIGLREDLLHPVR
jgi:hypothetical protein